MGRALLQAVIWTLLPGTKLKKKIHVLFRLHSASQSLFKCTIFRSDSRTLPGCLLNHKPGITSLPSTLDKPNGCDVTASRSDFKFLLVYRVKCVLRGFRFPSITSVILPDNCVSRSIRPSHRLCRLTLISAPGIDSAG